MNQTTELTMRPTTEMASLPPTDELRSAWELAKALVTTRFLPSAIDTPAKAVAIWLKGRELGIPFMLSMSSIHIIEGKPTASAELMRSLAFQRVRGFGMKVVQADDKACEIEFRRDGSEPFKYRYTIEDATRAGDANKNTYRKHPGPMLVARCTAQGLRLYCPDATMGVYAPEEFDGGESQPSSPEQSPLREVAAEVETKQSDRPEGEVAEAAARGGTRVADQPETPVKAASSTETIDYAKMFKDTMEAHYGVAFRGRGAGERLTRSVNAVAEQSGLAIKVESWSQVTPADWQSLALAAKAYVDGKRAAGGTEVAVTEGAPPAESRRWQDNTPVEAETALAEAAQRAMDASTPEEVAAADRELASANLNAKRAARRALYASAPEFLKACMAAEKKLFDANISHQFVFNSGGANYFIDGDILDACGMTSEHGVEVEVLTDDERVLLREEVEKFIVRRLA